MGLLTRYHPPRISIKHSHIFLSLLISLPDLEELHTDPKSTTRLYSLVVLQHRQFLHLLKFGSCPSDPKTYFLDKRVRRHSWDDRCRANSEHIRQSGPDSGPGLRVNVLKPAKGESAAVGDAELRVGHSLSPRSRSLSLSISLSLSLSLARSLARSLSLISLAAAGCWGRECKGTKLTIFDFAGVRATGGEPAAVGDAELRVGRRREHRHHGGRRAGHPSSSLLLSSLELSDTQVYEP